MADVQCPVVQVEKPRTYACRRLREDLGSLSPFSFQYLFYFIWLTSQTAAMARAGPDQS